MERKKISEICALKLQNCNLSLTLIQGEMKRISMERDEILKAEFRRLKCDPQEWKVDSNTWELVKNPVIEMPPKG